MRHRPPELHRKRARDMRADGTRPEDILWQMLKDRRLEGFKFRRQVPLKGYILDFVCFEARLIVEVDGWQHAESPTDAVRDATFRAEGFRILRFWNDEVTDSPDAVCRAILGELRNTGE
ncbi:endonuclease domain-containing protein [Rhizobium sp. KAs_5_22]|uniref:endonuclease domain-containing protein n=1 Tax=Ciceribacter selenitireducens TaxID=448181 RepID=UPI00048AB445|nr:endonuclease domain-containing protein [Ciceribacter selenitireducens]PPJ46826.1 endonuclease domain-containing protein [Rhizobium sp. KAs_5_22]